VARTQTPTTQPAKQQSSHFRRPWCPSIKWDVRNQLFAYLRGKRKRIEYRLHGHQPRFPFTLKW
jgi:hypothetical protein